MNTENTKEKQIAILFASNPEHDTLFITKDGKMFWDHANAAGHANSRLQDRSIETVERKQTEAEKKLEKVVKPNDPTSAKATADKKAAKKNKKAASKSSEAKEVKLPAGTAAEEGVTDENASQTRTSGDKSLVGEKPTTKYTKVTAIQWLKDHEVDFDETKSRNELLDLATDHFATLNKD